MAELAATLFVGAWCVVIGGNIAMTGRFTTSHVATAASADLPTSLSFPVRNPRISSGTNSSSGYSFRATPMPINAFFLEQCCDEVLVVA